MSNYRDSKIFTIAQHYLSAPHNFSINDFIDPSLYSLSYCTIDDAYRIINMLGPGALMSKIDLKKCIPSHPGQTQRLEPFGNLLASPILCRHMFTFWT